MDLSKLAHKRVVSVRDAAKHTGYGTSYIARLCRSGKITCEQVGGEWEVNVESLRTFVHEQAERKRARAEELAKVREEEYRRAQESKSTIATKAEAPAKPVMPKVVASSRVISVGPTPSVFYHFASGAVALAVVMSSALVAQAGTDRIAAAFVPTIEESLTGIRAMLSDAASTAGARVALVKETEVRSEAGAKNRVASAWRVSENIPSFAPSLKDMAFMAAPVEGASRGALAAAPVRSFATSSASAARSSADMVDASRRVAEAVASLSSRRVGELAASGYRASGELMYVAVQRAFGWYGDTLFRSGSAALAFGAATRDVLAAAPIAFGHGLQVATRSSINSFVALTYGWVDESPRVAQASMRAALALGGGLAGVVGDVSSAAPKTYVRSVYAVAETLPQASSAATLAATTIARVSAPVASTALALRTSVIQAARSSAVVANPLLSVAVPVVGPTSAAAAVSFSVVSEAGQTIAQAAYQAVSGFFHTSGNMLASIFSDSVPTVVLPNGSRVPAHTAPATSARPVVVSNGPVTQNIINQTTVQGASESFVHQSLAQLRSEMLTTVSGMLSPISNQVATNITTIQQVNMIQDLSNLIVRNGDFRGGTFDGGTISHAISINGVHGTLNDLTVTNASTTNATTSNAFVSSLVATNASTTNALTAYATTTNATTTNAFNTNLVATNATSTNSFVSNLVATLGHLVTGTIDNLTSTLATITGLNVTNSTTTNATSTNLYASKGVIDTFVSTLATIAGLNVTNSTTTNATTTHAFATNLVATKLTAGQTSLATTTISGTLAVSAPSTATSTFTGSLDIGNGSVVYSNATHNLGIGTTSPSQKLTVQGNALFSGDLSLADLVASGTANVNILVANLANLVTATIDNLTANLATIGGMNVTNSTTTNATSTNLYASKGVIDTLVSTLSTVTNLIATTFTGTNATITNLAVTNSTTTNATSTNSHIANLTATKGSFTALTAGTTSLATTTVAGDLTVQGAGHFSGVVTAANISAGGFALTGASNNTLLSTDASGNIVSTTTPSVAALFATSTTATSTFAGSLTVGKTARVTNLVATNATSTNSFVSNLVATLGHLVTGTIDNLTSTLATITGLNVTNSTTTNATSTNLYASKGVIDTFASALSTVTNLIATTFTGTNATITHLVATNATTTNATSTNSHITNLVATNATTTHAVVTNLTATNVALTNITAGKSTTTDATTTNAFNTNLVATNATTTNAFNTNLVATNATSTNSFVSNLVATLGHLVTGTIDNLTSTLATITGLNVTNSTTTNATSTNLYASKGVIDTFASALSTVTNLIATTFTGTNATITNLAVTNSTTTNATSTNSHIANLVATNATTTHAVVTNLTATNVALTNITAGKSTTTNATTTNAFNTNLVATNATTTNSFVSNLVATLGHLVTGTIDNLTSTLATITGLNVTNSTTTNATSTNLYASKGVIHTLVSTLATIAGLKVTNSTTTNATTTNAFNTNLVATNATARNFVISGTGANMLLTTNALGHVVSSSTPTAANYLATSTTATSTFAGAFSAASSLYALHNGRIGVGTASPLVAFDISATDAMRIPVGTSLERPTGATGYIRYNTTTHQFEGYGDVGVWQGLGGVIDADQSTYITADTNNTNEDYLRFFTNSLERMTITKAGNVGIGTTSPLSLLSIGTAGNAFRVDATGTVKEGIWNGTPLTSPYINFGTGANQVWAATVPTRDDGSYYPGTTANVNATLQEIGQQRSDRWSTGLVSGGDISIAAGNQINITAGTGYIGTARVTWGAKNSVAMLNNGDNYIAIDSNGNVNIAATKQNGDNYILLGYVYTTASNTAIGLISSLPHYAGNYTSRNNTFLGNAVGAIVESGNIVSETTPLALIATGGTINANLKEFSVADATTFTKWYQTADNGWVQDTANNLVNTADYNVTTNNQASALAAMTAGYWKKDLIIRTLDGHLHYVYGQAQYSTQQAAKDGPLPTTPTAIVNSGGGVYIATIVSQDGDTSIASRLFDVRPNLARVFGFGTSGTTGSVLSHSQLSGLLNDDHPQYLLTNGGRLLTGNLQMNSNAITGATNITMAGLLQNTLTTEQMRLRYDASNYTSFTVGSTGGLTIAPSGSATTTIGSGLAVGTMLNVTGNATVGSTLGVSGAATIGSTLGVTGTATVGNLIDSGVAANSLLYANASKQLAATTVSAPLSWSAGTLSIPAATASQNGYLASTDWTLFNNKMGSSTIASLTSNYIPKWNGTAFANSTIYDNGNVGIGTTTPAAKFSVQGSALFSGNLSLASLTATGTAAVSGAATIGGTLAVTGHTTFEGVTSTGATGTGNLVYSTSPTLTTPNLGTPSAVTLTNATGLPIATGVSGLGTGIATFLATPSSANLAAALTDETGTGSAVFSASPTFTGTVNGAALNFSGTATVGNLIDSGVAANSLLYANASKQLAATTISAPLSWSAGTLAIAQANGSTNGYLASTDWTTFNNKMGSSTIASLTSNYVPKWNGTAFANSTIYDNGNVGIGTTTPATKLQVYGGDILLSNNRFLQAYDSFGNIRGLIGLDNTNQTVIGNSASGGTIGLYTAGTQRITVLNNGNVGIGTANPGRALTIQQASGGDLLELRDSSGWYGEIGVNGSANGMFISGDYGSNGSKGVFVKSGGNVGIGTTSPSNLLSLYGSSANAGLGIDASGSGKEPQIRLSLSSVLYGALAVANGANSWANGAVAGDLVLRSDSAKKLMLQNGQSGGGLTITGGNVGIGTTNPGQLLSVNSSSGGNVVSLSGSGTNSQYLTFNTTGGTYYLGAESSAGGVLNTGGSAYALALVPAVSRKLQFGYNGGTGVAMTVDTTGNVGIGTTNPGSPLEVATTRSDVAGAGAITINGTQKYSFRATSAAPSNGFAIDSYNGATWSTPFVIANTGNVGIGKTNPGYMLDVNGAINATSVLINGVAVGAGGTQWASGAGGVISYTGGKVGIGTSSPSYPLDLTGYQRIYHATDPFLLLARGANTAYVENYQGQLHLQARSMPIYFETDTSYTVPKMMIDTSGNVGIGTTTPRSQLEIHGAIGSKFTDGLRVSRDGLPGPSQYVTLNYAGGSANLTAVNSMGTGAYTYFNRSDNGSTVTTSMVIDNNGNVGIGTTNPANTLDIGNGGGIHITSGVPASTAMALYNNSGTLMWNGVALGTGSSVSGTTGYLPKFTGSNTLGNSAIYQTSAGNVGIGTTVPYSGTNLTSLTINGPQYPTLALQSGGTNKALLWATQADVRLDTVGTIPLLFQPNGVEAMRITSTGTVGIGTTTPQYNLTVQDTTGSAIAANFVGGGSGAAVRIGGGIGYGLVQAYVNGTAGAASTNLALNATGGNVGIGTTNPAYKLDVNGAINATSVLINGVAVGAGGTQWASGTGGVISYTGGRVGIGTASPSTQLEVQDDTGVRITTSARTGIVDIIPSATLATIRTNYYSGADMPLVIGTWGNRTNQLYLATSGNVGIGTTNPGSLLEIANNVTGTTTYLTLHNSNAGGNIGNIDFAYNSPSQTLARITGNYQSTNGGFLAFTTAQNSTGTLTERMRIDNQGNVGIGTTNPSSFKLQVAGNIGPNAASSYNLGAAGLNWGCLYYNSGTLGTCASDARLKTDIAPLTFGSDPEAQIDGLLPRSFAYKTATSTIYHGLVAQEVLTVAPELVATSTDGYYTVKYGDVQWLMLAAMQQQSAKIVQIKSITDLVNLATLPEPQAGVAAECVTGDTKLKRRKKRADGSCEYDEVAIADVAVGDEILSLDEKSGRAVYRRVRALLPKGVQEVYELKTRSGRVIRTTENHPYLARVTAKKV